MNIEKAIEHMKSYQKMHTDDYFNLAIEALEERELMQKCGGCQYEDKTYAELPCRNCMRKGIRPDLYTK